MTTKSATPTDEMIPAIDRRPLSQEWRKSSYSGQGQSCLEARRRDDGMIQTRDTKHGEMGAILTFRPDEWDAFVRGVRAGEFDL